MASELDDWTLDKWLKRIRMGKYKQAFLDNGYDTPDLCANLSKEDLDAVGVTNKHHRSTLFTQARKLLEVVDNDSYLATADSVDGQNGDTNASGGGVPAVAVNGNLHSAAMTSSSSNNNKNSRVSQENPPATANQTGLMDYSEPWSGTTSSSGPQPLKPVKRVTSGPRDDVTDGPTSSPCKKPPSPGVSNDLSSSSSNASKKESTTGMTRLQFKLKIREELFRRNVVLSELPYCREVS